MHIWWIFRYDAEHDRHSSAPGPVQLKQAWLHWRQFWLFDEVGSGYSPISQDLLRTMSVRMIFSIL